MCDFYDNFKLDVSLEFLTKSLKESPCETISEVCFFEAKTQMMVGENISAGGG